MEESRRRLSHSGYAVEPLLLKTCARKHGFDGIRPRTCYLDGVLSSRYTTGPSANISRRIGEVTVATHKTTCGFPEMGMAAEPRLRHPAVQRVREGRTRS